MDRGALSSQNSLSPGNSNRECFIRENGASAGFELSLEIFGKSSDPNQNTQVSFQYWELVF